MFRSNLISQSVALSNEELQNLAPSIFASQPVADVSDRYSFLPTSSVLDGMRSHGWMPVRAEEQHVRTAERRGFQKHRIRFARAEKLDTWAKDEVRPESFFSRVTIKAVLTNCIVASFGRCV